MEHFRDEQRLLDQTVSEMKGSSYIILQLDESTDVACCEQLGTCV
jgi:hypothetical protein